MAYRESAPGFAVSLDWMVVCAVRYEPVSDCNSLITGKYSVETGSHGTAHTTIQSSGTADFQANSKPAVSVGIFAGIVPLFRSLVTLAVSQADFGLPSLHPKIPFPAAGVRRPIPFGNPGILEV